MWFIDQMAKGGFFARLVYSVWVALIMVSNIILLGAATLLAWSIGVNVPLVVSLMVAGFLVCYWFWDLTDPKRMKS